MRNHTSWFMQIEKTVWKSLFLTGHTIIYFILWILMSVFLICWFINLENLETVLLSFNIHLASVWLFLKMITHVTFKFLFLLYRCHTGYIDMVFLRCESTCYEKHSLDIAISKKGKCYKFVTLPAFIWFLISERIYTIFNLNIC